MGQVNLYKIDDHKKDDFLNNLHQKFQFLGEQDYYSLECKDNSFTVGTYVFTPKERKKIEWQWVLDEYDYEIEGAEGSPRAILVIENELDMYAVTYGLSYFAVDKYCDIDFAFEFARRIKFKQIKTTTLTAPNAQRNKMVNVYLKKLKGQVRKSSVDNMFKGSGSYTETEKDMIDTILVDEAHRLNGKSGMFHNVGENQIKEIIHSSVCNVFFIDERQRVTLSDIGSIAEIKKWAKEEQSDITEMELVSQFRCDGSDGYLAWLDDVLEIRETANKDMREINYDIRICDSPIQMEKLIIERNKASNHARMLAGYCWNWISSGKNNSSVHDIKIGDFEKSWNLGNTTTFAIDDDSINEVGCIHTAQGLEFDYVGVIIGEDMRFENGHVVTDFTKRAQTDQSLKGIKKLNKENPEEARKRADEIIKNTYRTLLTRGMKGCYVYCVDDKMREYLKDRLGR